MQHHSAQCPAVAQHGFTRTPFSAPRMPRPLVRGWGLQLTWHPPFFKNIKIKKTRREATMVRRHYWGSPTVKTYLFRQNWPNQIGFFVCCTSGHNAQLLGNEIARKKRSSGRGSTHKGRGTPLIQKDTTRPWYPACVQVSSRSHQTSRSYALERVTNSQTHRQTQRK